MNYLSGILAMLLVASAGAGELIPRGVIGNSGVASETLLQDTSPGFVSGLTWGPKKNFWTFQSQTRLVKLQKGRLSASFVVADVETTETAPVRMATIDKYIVAMFRSNKQIKYIDHTAEEDSSMKTLQLVEDLDWDQPVAMADEAIDKKLILANGKNIIAVDIESGKSKKLIECADVILEQGLDVNSKGIIYASTAERTYSYYADATELRNGPSLGAPISATETMVFGFGKGLVNFSDWNLSSTKSLTGVRTAELGQVAQLIQLDSKTVAVTGSLNKIYIGKIKGDEVTWHFRYGGINALSVGLNAEGHIFAAVPSKEQHAGGILAWNWRQPPNGAPAFSELVATTLPFPQIVPDEAGSAWGVIGSVGNQGTATTLWQFGLATGKVRYCTLSGERPYQPSAMCRIDNKILMLSADSDDIFQMGIPSAEMMTLEVKRMGWAGDTPLSSPKSLAPWTQKRFLVSDGDKIHLIQKTVGGCTALWDLDSWGDEERFGDELYISTSGDYLFVSDTKRHRVLVFSLTTRTLQAQIGDTDKAGNKKLLNLPTGIAASGPRIVVYDSGNKRILKFKFKP